MEGMKEKSFKVGGVISLAFRQINEFLHRASRKNIELVVRPDMGSLLWFISQINRHLDDSTKSSF